jgi:GNAT superfamily N-acetyltransferase
MTEFTIRLDPTEAEIEALRTPLLDHLKQIGRDIGYRPYSILLSDTPGGPVTGGLYGYVLFEWLFIQYVSVPETLRGQGVGTELMAQAEAWVRAEGLAGLWLDTFAFQARSFYEKLGYSVFGEITDHPRGSSRYFLKKQL